MKKTIINANDCRYISQIPEFKNELPKGILNKKKADVGGTFAALNYPTNYIIVVPSLSLIDSILADDNLSYIIFDVKGGTNWDNFYIYLEEESIHKIVVTYDSFDKLVKWLKYKDIDTNKYKVLIDEFHNILDNYGFRRGAIDSLIKTTEKFKHITYMSATPMDDIFIPDILKDQPYTIIEWNDNSKIGVKRFETHNTNQVVITLIDKFLNEKGLHFTQINGKLTRVEELYIFVNSVKDIATISRSLNLNSNIVKVVCNDKIYNKRIMDGVGLTISNINDDNKKINFFTSKAFAGCNLFTNNGLVVAVSSSEKKHKLIDVQTSLFQIQGRIRTNDEFQNIFRHLIIHIYSSYGNIHPDRNQKKFSDEALEIIRKQIKRSNDIISLYNKSNKSEKETYKLQVKKEPFLTDYNKDEDKYELSNMMIKYKMYQFKLIYHVYANGISLKNSYDNDHFDVSDIEEHVHINNDLEYKIALTVNFRDLIKGYIELRNKNKDTRLIERFEIEYPIFKKAYDELGTKGISSCNFSERKIKDKLHAYSPEILNNVFSKIFNHVGATNFIIKVDLRIKIIETYDELGIDIKKIGFTTTDLIKKVPSYVFKKGQRRINGKAPRGYEISFDPIKLYEFVS